MKPRGIRCSEGHRESVRHGPTAPQWSHLVSICLDPSAHKRTSLAIDATKQEKEGHASAPLQQVSSITVIELFEFFDTPFGPDSELISANFAPH